MQGSGAARAVKALRDNPERFLATVQVGITVVGATAAAFGGTSIPQRWATPSWRGGHFFDGGPEPPVGWGT